MNTSNRYDPFSASAASSDPSNTINATKPRNLNSASPLLKSRSRGGDANRSQNLTRRAPQQSYRSTSTAASNPIYNHHPNNNNQQQQASLVSHRTTKKANIFSNVWSRIMGGGAEYAANEIGDNAAIVGADSSLGGANRDYYAKNVLDTDDSFDSAEDEYIYDEDAPWGGNRGRRPPQKPQSALKQFSQGLVKWVVANSWLYFLTFCMVMARSIDFTFYVRLAYKMRNYEFILSGIILSFAFNLITWPIVWFRIYVTGQITPEMRKFPKRKFFFMGLMDSLNVIVTTIPAALVSGVLNVVMAQSVIILNVCTSYIFLNYRFGVTHWLGLVVLCSGIIIAVYPLFLDSDDVGGPLGPAATAVFVFLLFIGNLPMAMSNCYKELYLKSADLDIFYMNGYVALFQFLLGIALFPMVFIPLPGGAPYVKPAEFGEYFVNGMKCFAGINTQTVITGMEPGSSDACPGTWIIFSIFIAFNMCYNLLILAVMQKGSSTLAVVASAARLALSNFAFLIRPIAGASTIPSLSINDIISLILLIVGILFYGARPEKMATANDVVYRVKQRFLRTFCFFFYKKEKPQLSGENRDYLDSDLSENSSCTNSTGGGRMIQTPSGDDRVIQSDDDRQY